MTQPTLAEVPVSARQKPATAPPVFIYRLDQRRMRAAEQLVQLRDLLDAVSTTNPFYCRKLAHVNLQHAITSAEAFTQRVPFTLKSELVEDQQQHPPYGSNLTYPVASYTRCHHTSGSTGRPLYWLDTPESWRRMLDVWQTIFNAAEVSPSDRLFFAFSFGPFLGFWTAFESAQRMGCFCLPGGGLSTEGRLQAMLDHGMTVLCCTPTYALRLGEAARETGVDLSRGQIKVIITAGEPGGSIPATRSRISALWNGARVFDHHGLTETGPVSYECPCQPGVLHIVEEAFLAEVVDPATGHAAAAGSRGELVLTTLLRAGSPLIRYRTGDVVRPLARGACACGSYDLALEGGVIGRSDDMVIVRGVNIYPSAVEAIIRQHPQIAEYQVTLDLRESMAELRVEIELWPDAADASAVVYQLEKSFQSALALRVPVTVAAAGALPRFEMKARRWIRQN